MSWPFFFWNYKTPADNAWHPQPSAKPIKGPESFPVWFQRTDIEAAVVDTVPFIAGAGGLAHLRQFNDLGWTVPASIFKNRTTMLATHRAGILLMPLTLLCQGAGVDYRYWIPRWSHDRERRRDEQEVRTHVDWGMGFGSLCWLVRMSAFGAWRVYWAPLEIVMGGALADVMHREYCRAHDL